MASSPLLRAMVDRLEELHGIKQRLAAFEAKHGRARLVSELGGDADTRAALREEAQALLEQVARAPVECPEVAELKARAAALAPAVT